MKSFTLRSDTFTLNFDLFDIFHFRYGRAFDWLVRRVNSAVRVEAM